MIGTRTSSPSRLEAEPSFGELLKELSCESRELVQQEIELAKTEMAEKAAVYSRNVAYLAVGGLVGFAGFLVLLGAASYGLMEALDERIAPSVATWLAPLIVGVVVAIVGYVLIQKALTTLKHESLAPCKTLQTLRENKQWLQDRMT